MGWSWRFFIMAVMIGIPDARILPGSWVDGPGGGITLPTNDRLVWDRTADAANYRDVNGSPGAEPIITGDISSSASHEVDVSIPGSPNRTARYTVDGNGANEPYVLTGVRTVAAVTSGDGYQEPRGAATIDGRRHRVYADYANDRILYSYREWEGADESSTVTVWSSSGSYGTSGFLPNPEIKVVRSAGTGGYSLFVFGWETIASGEVRLRVARSDDQGTTWRTYWTNIERTHSGSLYSLGVKVAFDPLGRNWTLTLLDYNSGTYTLQTWVSSQIAAAEWRRVDSADLDNVTDWDILTELCGGGVRTYMRTITSSDTNIRTYERSSAFSGWRLIDTDSDVTADSGSGIAITSNAAGWLYSVFRSSSDNDKIQMQVAVSPSIWGKPFGTFPYQDAGSDTIIDDDADGTSTALGNGINIHGLTFIGEEAGLLGTLSASATTVDNSIAEMVLGGYSNYTTDATPSGVDVPYYATSIPETKSPQYQAFVTGGSTAQSIVEDSNGNLMLRLSNDNSTGYNDYRLVGDPSVAGADLLIGRDSTGGSTSSDAIALWLKCHDDGNANNYGLAVRVDATTRAIQAYDLVDSSNIGMGAGYAATADLVIRAVLDGESGKASVYYRLSNQRAWSVLIEDQSLVSTGGGLTSSILWGKLAASTAQVDTNPMIPYGSASDEYVASLADATAELLPIRATSCAQLLPSGLATIRWGGVGPLMGGDGWTVATVGESPWALSSPLCPEPSPTRQYRGKIGSAGAIYTQPFETPAGGMRLSNGLAYVSWANKAPISAMQVMRWESGSASWVENFGADVRQRPFGSDASVGWRRDNATSLRFSPDGSNGIPRFRYAHEMVGKYVLVGDNAAVNTIAGYISHWDDGQFTNESGHVQASFSLDPDTVTVTSGSLAALATSTGSGYIIIYPQGGAVIGVEADHTDAYGAVRFQLAPGVSQPKAGLVTLGSLHPLARPTRDGSSIRYLSKGEVKTSPGGLTGPGRAQSRKRGQIYDLPYETLLGQPGRYSDGTKAPPELIGTSAYYALDNNADVIEAAHALCDSACPVMLGFGVFSADPASTELVLTEDDVVHGFMRNVDRIQTLGTLGVDGLFNRHGTKMTLEELT